MTSEFDYLSNPRSIKYYIGRYLKRHVDEISGSRVADLPAGSGVTSWLLRELGADVAPFDLFPEFFDVEGLECKTIDLNDDLPIESDFYSFVICQEGIEHVPDQQRLIGELARVLSPGGKLIITTPNYSCLAAKLSYLLFESESLKRMPPNIFDDMWREDSARRYFGHMFLLGAQKIQSFAALHGLRLVDVESNVLSKGSLLLSIFLYPVVVLFSARCLIRNMRHASSDSQRNFYRQQWRLNISPKVLTSKYLFMVYQK